LVYIVQKAVVRRFLKFPSIVYIRHKRTGNDAEGNSLAVSQFVRGKVPVWKGFTANPIIVNIQSISAGYAFGFQFLTVNNDIAGTAYYFR
jgi:hypothetical protein